MTKEVEDWFVSTLTQTMKYREKNNIVRHDYLDLLISLKNKPGKFGKYSTINLLVWIETDSNLIVYVTATYSITKFCIYLLPTSGLY